MTDRELIEQKLLRIAALKDGWAPNERAVSEEALSYFYKVFNNIDDKYMHEVEPVPHNGGLHLEWDNEPMYYSAAIDHDGTLWLFQLHMDAENDTEQEIKDPEPDDLISFIMNYGVSK